jgi:hypothetical protein
VHHACAPIRECPNGEHNHRAGAAAGPAGGAGRRATPAWWTKSAAAASSSKRLCAGRPGRARPRAGAAGARPTQRRRPPRRRPRRPARAAATRARWWSRSSCARGDWSLLELCPAAGGRPGAAAAAVPHLHAVGAPQHCALGRFHEESPRHEAHLLARGSIFQYNLYDRLNSRPPPQRRREKVGARPAAARAGAGAPGGRAARRHKVRECDGHVLGLGAADRLCDL